MSDLEEAYKKVNARISKLIIQPSHESDDSDNSSTWRQVNNIKKDLITLIKERSISENISVKEYEWRVREAFELVDNIKYSLTKQDFSFENKTKEKHWSLQKKQLLWFHMSPEVAQGRDMENLPEINYKSLLDSASDYISNSWMQHDYIDWILLDSLIYAEMMEYRTSHLMGITYGDVNWTYTFHGGDFNKQMWTEFLFPKAIFCLRYIIPITTIATLYYFDLEKSADVIGSIYALYFAYRLILWPKRSTEKQKMALQKDKSDQIIGQMFRVYTCCSTPIINPGIIKKLLHESAKDGCIFNGVVYALVDSISLKNPIFLKPDFLKELDLDEASISWEWES